MSHNVHPAIVGLLRQLPQPVDPWTEADRDRFIVAFTSMVKFLYPVKGDDAASPRKIEDTK